MIRTDGKPTIAWANPEQIRPRSKSHAKRDSLALAMAELRTADYGIRAIVSERQENRRMHNRLTSSFSQLIAELR